MTKDSYKGKSVKTAAKAIAAENPGAVIEYVEAMYAEERYTRSMEGIENRRVRYVDSWNGNLFLIHC